jgi:hypothetical protein
MKINLMKLIILILILHKFFLFITENKINNFIKNFKLIMILLILIFDTA